MKTLLIALEYPPAIGGVETYYAELVKQWPEEIQVINNQQKQLVGGFFRWLPGQKNVAQMLAQFKPDWLIVGEILPLGTIAWLLSYFFTFKYAVILHGLDFSLATRNWHKRWLNGLILRRADKIITVNSYTADLVQKMYPRTSAKIRTVNPGATELHPAPLLVRTLKENYNLENTFVLMTMGRLVKRKGVDMVLRAVFQLSKTIPNFRYVIIGQGPDKNYIQGIIDELGLDEKVVLLPTVANAEREAWLAVADVFVMPARNINGDYEGFGIVYLDAAMAVKPVIAGKSGGVKDAVIADETGLIVDEEDPTAIATAVRRLYEDPTLRKRLGEAGQKRAQSMDWRSQIKKIYTELQN